MLRLSKLTDYGILLLTHIARAPGLQSRTTRDLANSSRLPLPTVEKLLKTLSRAKVLSSERGVKGGYRLARHPDLISLAQIIEAIEGPICITECTQTDTSRCEVRETCTMKSQWQKVNTVLRAAFQSLTLSALILPLDEFDPKINFSPKLSGLRREQGTEALSHKVVGVSR